MNKFKGYVKKRYSVLNFVEGVNCDDNEYYLKPGVAKIISGGPMMGFAMPNANFPVAKNTSGVLFLTPAETYLVNEDPCIGCGRCVDICSCRITPVLINRALKANDLDEAVKLGLMDCVECGTCAYVCPAKVRLVQRFRVGKSLYRAELLKKQQKAKEEQEKQAASSKEGDK